MAFQPVPDTAEIDMIFTLNGITVQNTHYARLVGGYNLTDLQAMADAIDLAWSPNFQSFQPSECSYVQTEVRGLANENDLVASQNLSAAAGVHAGDTLPNQVTYAIKKTSGLTGRSARGRVFWIGIPDSEIQNADENFIQFTYQTSIVNAIDSIRLKIATVGTWEAVLVSRFTAGAKRATGAVFPWIGTIAVDLRLDTQRGRLPTP